MEPGPGIRCVVPTSEEPPAVLLGDGVGVTLKCWKNTKMSLKKGDRHLRQITFSVVVADVGSADWSRCFVWVGMQRAGMTMM